MQTLPRRPVPCSFVRLSSSFARVDEASRRPAPTHAARRLQLRATRSPHGAKGEGESPWPSLHTVDTVPLDRNRLLDLARSRGLGSRADTSRSAVRPLQRRRFSTAAPLSPPPGITAAYPYSMTEFAEALAALDKQFVQNSTQEGILESDPRAQWDASRKQYVVNLQIVDTLDALTRQIRSDGAAAGKDASRWRLKAYNKAIDVVQSCRIPVTSTAVALVLLREAGNKLKDEEKYYMRHGCHRSSVLERIRQIIATGACEDVDMSRYGALY
ncbi:unnamed protein product [Vitrella brassicaformis CCMP3155]|uniref:Uncharacterized protein n=2 Tax=Vitrella brassicaformis TaxID=1169539 RepID=A0A0G4G086_VITBC|nr:unnamed protein product [Vitrella brassicaformis CCMP3155]|eukprot:CEM21271.1 unnamed protein product [Vitrella brassicaformis CCMP3155]